MKFKMIIGLSLAGTMGFAQSPGNTTTGAYVNTRNTAHPSIVRCATVEHESDLEQRDPNRAAERQAYDQMINAYIAAHGQELQNTRTTTVIPVVVHVVWHLAYQDISDQQVQSQITVLNEDYMRLNADTVNTPAAFKPVAASVPIQFCLAQRDPNGNPTTGIERRQTTAVNFSYSGDPVKAYSTGGLDAWDPTRYMNIWVCNLTGGILGYGEFPTTSVSQTYGVVIMFNAFGNTGNVAAPYDLGRTATHEFSHCFNLHHIWGDDGGYCYGTDYCNDTPNQGDATYGSPSGVVTDNCTTTSPGIMYENYMDYSDDAVLNIFTNDQKTRMLAVINSAPYNALKTSNGCLAVGIPNYLLDNIVNLFPNPSSGHINVEVSLPSAEHLQFIISDALGRTVLQSDKGSTYGGTYSFDLADEPQGVYSVAILAGENRIVKRIVLTR